MRKKTSQSKTTSKDKKEKNVKSQFLRINLVHQMMKQRRKIQRRRRKKKKKQSSGDGGGDAAKAEQTITISSEKFDQGIRKIHKMKIILCNSSDIVSDFFPESPTNA